MEEDREEAEFTEKRPLLCLRREISPKNRDFSALVP
jgi:hypothetical protein